MNGKSFYFAYGSNLHPVRLRERVPSAALVGIARQSQYELRFHKKGADGSGKCNMCESLSAYVYGAIYELDSDHKKYLDRAEGKGKGYIDKDIIVVHGKDEYACFTYLAQPNYILANLAPYSWYKALVTIGASYLGFPAEYLSNIESVVTVEDSCLARKKSMDALIERMIAYGN